MDDEYEWGERPDDHNFIAPLIVAQDTALSLRASGLMFRLLAMPKGSPTDSVALAERTTEGRDAVRAALAELETAGYIDRRKRRGSNGQWITTLRLLPFGRFRRSGPAPENPAPVSPAPVEPAPVSQAISPEERGSSTETQRLKDAAAAFEYQQGGEAAAIDPSRQGVQDGGPTEGGVTDQSQIPWTVRHLLTTWFNVNDYRQQQAWLEAWAAAIRTNGETGYDVETDLTAYLTRCREEKREAKPSRWLRFLTEDRIKWGKTQQHHDEVLQQRDNADGGEQWALQSLRRTPVWNVTQEGT